MDYSDTLLTVAELSLALAGFASLVSVIGRDRKSDSTAADALRLRNMLEVSLIGAGFAVLPLPFLEATAGEPKLWRVASGIHLLVVIGLIFYGISRYRTIRPTPDPLPSSILMSSFSAISILLDGCNVIGIGGKEAFSLYFASLLLGLGIGGTKFIVVAGSILDRGDG